MTNAKEIINNEFSSAKIQDRLSSVLGKMKNEAYSEILIFDENKLKGIFSPNYATRSKIDIVNTKVDKFTKPANCVTEETELKEVIKEIINSDHDTIPVKKNQKVVGIIHSLDILNIIKNDLKKVKIKDVKKKQNKKVSENDRIGKIIEILNDKSLHALVILNEKKEATDLITHYDIMRNINFFSHGRDSGQKHGTISKAFKAEKDDLNGLPAYDFIEYKNSASLTSEDSLAKAIDLMINNDVLNVLVKDEPSIIRAKDILRYYNGKF
ncbi:CBS domain-containing protein [Candidatus Woesearchaeota archaeon]|nr:CBS domain-containing protein [Candidatus Woesearchaeota archaeon]